MARDGRARFDISVSLRKAMLRALIFVGLTVSVAPVAAQGIPLAGSGILAQLAPRQQTILSSEVPARINRLPFKEGMDFKAGDLLVGFDCSAEKAKLERARAALSAAETKFKVAERLRKFNSTTELETELAAAEAAKARAEMNAEAATVAKCVLTAPFSGKVAEVKVYSHQFVKAGQELMRVIDDSVLEVEFLAPSSWLSWLRPGSAFRITVTETGSTHEASVIRLGASVDPISHSIKVVGKISERDPALMGGMTGRIAIMTPSEGS